MYLTELQWLLQRGAGEEERYHRLRRSVCIIVCEKANCLILPFIAYMHFFEDIKIPFSTWVSVQGEVMHIIRKGFVDCGKASQNLTSEKGQICEC